jgi:hypothetical protein
LCFHKFTNLQIELWVITLPFLNVVNVDSELESAWFQPLKTEM